MSEQSRKVEDYLPGGKTDPAGGVIEDNITDADQQQEARERDPVTGQFVAPDATPAIDWEERYKNLEKLNSQQAQYLGQYKQLVDDHITNPTPETQAAPEESKPITLDDLYEHPDETVRSAVDSHPAIQEIRDLKADLQKRDMADQVDRFKERHPDFQAIGTDPKFRTWVDENSMRQELFTRGNQYDLSAADALFSLYKAEQGITQIQEEQTQQQQIQAATLEESSQQMVTSQPQYSRSEYVDTLTRARQGDLQADLWIKRNAAGYREALGSGNVRD